MRRTGALAAVVALGLATAARAATAVQPACGVTGYVCAVEYTFGTKGNVRTLDDLRRLFTPDAPWGRINEELQAFPPFNARNHVLEKDCLALTGIHDGSTVYDAWGHITSGALISRITARAPCLVEFVAQQPRGEGVWPSLWLYDTHSGRHDASEIDVLESQNHPPKLDRSMVFQNDHGPGAGAVLENPGGIGPWGDWRPYGPMPKGDLARRYAAYSVHWLPDRTVKYVDDRMGIARAFRWTGPEEANLLVYQSIGSSKLDWPGPVGPGTFARGAAVFRLKSIRVFVPEPADERVRVLRAWRQFVWSGVPHAGPPPQNLYVRIKPRVALEPVALAVVVPTPTRSPVQGAPPEMVTKVYRLARPVGWRPPAGRKAGTGLAAGEEALLSNTFFQSYFMDLEFPDRKPAMPLAADEGELTYAAGGREYTLRFRIEPATVPPGGPPPVP